MLSNSAGKLTNVKQTTSILLAVAFCLLFSTCKKGEDDPFFSFRTRRARVEGKWRVQSGTVYANYVNFKEGWRDNMMFDIKSATFFLTRTGYNGKPITATGSDVIYLNFTKDGRFELTEMLSSYHLECSGQWHFNQRADGKKAKEYLEMTITNYDKGNSKTALFNQDQESFSYRIKELRNKKMVIESNSSGYTDEITKTEITFKNEYVLVQD